MHTRSIAAVLAAGLSAALLGVPASAAQADARHGGNPGDTQLTLSPPPNQGERNYIVQLERDVPLADILPNGKTATKRTGKAFNGAVLPLKEEEAAALRDEPGVLSVEPDGVIVAGSVSTGVKRPIAPEESTGRIAAQRVTDSWGLDRTDQRHRPLDGQYRPSGDGSGVRVYIVDSGIDHFSADFTGRIGDGAYAYGSSTQDCDGHGTHVSGIAGSSRFGMATGVTLHPVRVLDCDGTGSVEALLAGLNWIAADAPARSVVNVSLGGPRNTAIDAAVSTLVARGVVVVAAAGNYGEDARYYSPAGEPSVLTVGAVDESDEDTYFSNYGPALDLYAPGSEVVSTGLGSTYPSIMSGTSMAAPHVAGAAALWWGLNPSASGQAVSSAVMSLATEDILTFPYGQGGSPNVNLHVESAEEFVGVSPARLLDTRNGTGGASGAVGSGRWVDVQVTGRGGVPASGVSAVVLNVTATEPTAAGYVTAWPAGETRPLASNLNFTPGQTVPNAVVVKVGAGGRVSLFNSAGSTHLIADVGGYYTAGTGFTALTPKRLVDSRTGAGGVSGPVSGTVDIPVAGLAGVPGSGVSSVVLNVTVTEPTGAGYATVWPAGAPRPNASNLNFTPGLTVPNLIIAKLGAGGKISFHASEGTHMVIDVLGYHAQASGYTPLVPSRTLDTRDGTGAARALVPGGGTVALQVAGRGGVPTSGASSVVLNVTVTEPRAPGYITTWPSGITRPLASNLNYIPGQTVPNLVVVPLGADGKVNLYNGSGAGTHLIADVQGWY